MKTPSPQKLTKAQRNALELRQAKKYLIFAWLGIIVLMLWMLSMWLGWHALTNHTLSAIVLFVISSFIVFVCGKQVMKSAWKSLLHWTPNMHVLTAIGTIAALSTGVLTLLHELGVVARISNFTAIAGMIMGFHLTGSYIEQSLKHRSTNAIKALIALRPQHATIIENNKERVIPITELKLNDIVVVKTGEKVPSDGIIIDGVAEIDEALITGESMPVLKEAQSRVIGGSINVDGRFLMRIEKIGKTTFLQQVIRLVEMAQGSKPKIQLLADKVIAVFVPTILGIAVFTFLAWLLFYNQLAPRISSIFLSLGISMQFANISALTAAIFSSIAVLVVACPCALGLATPSAIATGVGRGAQLGALIKNATIFENLSHADTIIMDKTGTITQGKPSLVEIFADHNYTNKEILYLSAAVESNSTHPLAKAVVEYYASTVEQDIEVFRNSTGGFADRADGSFGSPITDNTAINFKTLVGEGLRGEVQGSEIIVANARYVQNHKLIISAQLQRQIESFASRGLTTSTVIKDNIVIGIMGFKDEVHPESVQAIQNLHKMHLSTTMLTGDNQQAAALVAEQVGVTNTIAEALPSTKLEVVQSLQSKGSNVIMVGDGINDAPALTQANIGVAMGAGTAIAGEAGDIVLMKSSLSSLVSALTLSNLTYRVIKQNLFWAFFYNILLIPMSMMGLVHPLFAEIAMGISSITVLLNSIRISRFGRVRR